mmetsp:Transcript_2582/g.10012  ORF Transcript_2582/g.10012 Transcript_2582/m.10012 type:complete len:223 (-) Transcript_2582:256-924(-)
MRVAVANRERRPVRGGLRRDDVTVLRLRRARVEHRSRRLVERRELGADGAVLLLRLVRRLERGVGVERRRERSETVRHDSTRAAVSLDRRPERERHAHRARVRPRESHGERGVERRRRPARPRRVRRRRRRQARRRPHVLGPRARRDGRRVRRRRPRVHRLRGLEPTLRRSRRAVVVVARRRRRRPRRRRRSMSRRRRERLRRRELRDHRRDRWVGRHRADV